MRLHVRVLGAEKLFGAVARQVLHHVGELAAAVIALAWIAFGILVRENASGRLQNGFGREVLARDQFELRILAFQLMAESPRKTAGSASAERASHSGCF